MMGRRGAGPPSGAIAITQWATAVATNSTTATATSTVTATLPAGQTGRPRILRASGNQTALSIITYGASAQIHVPVNPNAQYSQDAIPPSAFPSPTNSVPVTVTLYGKGSVLVSIGFQ